MEIAKLFIHRNVLRTLQTAERSQVKISEASWLRANNTNRSIDLGYITYR